MKRWKYLLGMAILLCLVVTLMALPVFGAELVETGSCGDSATYTLDADGVLTISGSGSITSSAFQDNSIIKKLVVEPGITSIGSATFSGCISMTSATLPDGLTQIGTWAFEHCDSLINIEIPQSVTTIGIHVFNSCDALQGIWVKPQNSNFASDDWGVLFNKDMTILIQAPGGIRGSYATPDRLTNIESFAFYDCASLTSVTLPKGLTSIGDHAFSDCDSLTSVTLPEGLTSIGDSVFSSCDSLTNVTLPEGLVSIGDRAFYNCDSLTSVALPKGLTSIGDNAFISCASLTNVALPEGLTSIGNYAFCWCDSLTSLTLPEGLTSIGDHAFSGCDSLTSVTLPEGLTSIGSDAFVNCNNLYHLIFLGDLPAIAENAFEYSSPTVYYVEGNSTWNDDAMQKYGGTPTYKPLGSPVELVVKVADPYPYYFTGDRIEKRDVEAATLVYDSGARSLLHPGMFELTGGDLSSPGIKDLTVTARGFSDSVTIYVHNGGVTEVDSAEWPESGHNYKNSTDDTQVLTVPGADQIQITFSGQTHVESDYDYLYVYDGGGKQVGAYTGSEAAGKMLTVQGDTVKIRLVTDGTGTDWGYALSHVEAMWVEHVYDASGSCTICGTSQGCAHSYGEGVITAEPTCQAEGITSYTCVDCGLVYQEPIPRKGHSYDVVTGICDMCGGNTPFSVEAPQMEYCYGSSQVKVKAQWTKVSGIDGYELYMSTDRDDLSSYERVKTVQDPNTLNYTKGGLTPGVTYYFRVCAYVIGEDGLTRVRSPLSNVKCCMPTVLWDAPYSNSDFRIRLRWEPVEGADGFQIWRKGEGEDYRVVKTLKDGGADAYSNVSLKAGGTYTYKMRAYFINEDGSKSYGAYSDEITVGVQPSKPKVTVVSTKAGRAQVSWEDLYGASAYQVWMSESPNSGFKIAKSIYDGDVTSYTKSGLVSGKTYYFKVRASVEIDGKKTFGAYSEVIAVTVK